MQKYHLTLLLQRWSFEIRKLEFMFSRLLVTLWLDFLLSEALKFIEKKTQQFDSIILDEKYLEKSGSNRSTLFNSISFVTVSNKEEFAETESISVLNLTVIQKSRGVIFWMLLFQCFRETFGRENKFCTRNW